MGYGLSYAAAVVFLLGVVGCDTEPNYRYSGGSSSTTTLDVEVDLSDPNDGDYSDWNDLTHSKNVDPNYDEVFAQGTVLRIDLTISAANWTAMWNDLSNNLSSSSGMSFGGGLVDVDFTPVWVPCTLTYDDTKWYQVGVRYKGNSSLSTTYSSGNKKLSMKLDFDEFEDDFPSLKNQRFYGFKQLNLNNNYNDKSFVREKVASDVFRNFGIAAPETSFCEVYIDYGSGSKYFGLFTIVEEVDDTVLDTQFGGDSGNLYKPEDDAASFAKGTYNTDEFYLKNNEETCDYSDVKALYDILHDSSRTSDEEAWKESLEAVLDVDMFMQWLAVNTVIQNWDTYGNMAHNYFLYNNHNTGLLTWIPWDNNESLQSGDGALSLDMSKVSSSWPLISYLIAVDEYKALYDGYVQRCVDEVFVTSEMVTLYEYYYTLLKDYAYAEETGRSFLTSDSQFDSAISTLKTHVASRASSVASYLK